MENKRNTKLSIVGSKRLPAHYSDSDNINQIFKCKSGYYVSEKGWIDGEEKKCNPPTKSGYYYDEYMSQYIFASTGLPF